MSYEEENNYVAIETSVSSLDVPEGGRETFNVRLSGPPKKGRAVVSVVPAAGDTDISIVSGNELYFKRKDYNQWQTVTLAAARGGRAEDRRAEPERAMVR